MWVHGDWASIDDDGAVVPPRPQRRHDQGGRQAPRAGRGRVGARVAPRGRRGGGGRGARRGEGRGARGASSCSAPGRRAAPTSCAPSSSTSVADHLGKSFRPSAVRFTDALPKTRSAKVLRRAIRAAALGADPGDLSSLEDPAALDAMRCRRATVRPSRSLRGRRVMLRPLVLGRLRELAGGAPAQRRLADQVGAPARRRPARHDRGPRRLRRPVQRPPAGAPARHRLRLRDLRRRHVLRRDQPELACSGARSRAPTSATGSTRSGPARATCPRRWSSLVRFAFEELRLHRVQVVDHPPQPRPAGGWSRSSASATRASPCATSRSTASWEDHVRYAITAEEWQERREELVARLARPRLSDPRPRRSLRPQAP